MRLLRVLFFLLLPVLTNAQTINKIEGQSYTSTQDTWTGVNISRSGPTLLTFKNNSITSSNRYGYLLQAGDERAASTNNNLDKAVITGNKLVWKGSDMVVIPHGIFTGHNKDVIVKYNYLDQVPMGIIRKSTTNMSNSSGGVAYNIVKGGAVAIVVKGMSNVNIYNNTLYNNRTPSQTWRPLIHIYTNVDAVPNSFSHGTKIYNNIMYTKYQTFAISVDDNESLTDLKCDYNVYWCETGSPKFSVAGVTKTFAQWQAMGFDTHSKVVDPKFKDLVSFVPAARLDFGTNLGSEWQSGLSVNAVWGKTDPVTANQNGTWQVGAVIYEALVSNVPSVPVYVSSVINNDKPSVLEATYNMGLANLIPAQTAFTVNVNSVARSISSLTIADAKVILTLSSPIVYGDVVTVTYTKPSINALSTPSGGQAATIAAQPVQNNLINVPVAEVPVYMSSVVENASPAHLELTYNLALANVIPAGSSFSATVNGIAITIVSVSLNGSKVDLALSSAVQHNDVITISYNRPSVSQLQSNSGGIAENFVSQSVVNNIVPPAKPTGENENDIIIYPNPAREYISIDNLKPSVEKRIMKVFNFSGKLFMELSLDYWKTQNISLNLKTGLYFIEIITGRIVEHVQTIVIM